MSEGLLFIMSLLIMSSTCIIKAHYFRGCLGSLKITLVEWLFYALSHCLQFTPASIQQKLHVLCNRLQITLQYTFRTHTHTPHNNIMITTTSTWSWQKERFFCSSGCWVLVLVMVPVFKQRSCCCCCCLYCMRSYSWREQCDQRGFLGLFKEQVVKTT